MEVDYFEEVDRAIIRALVQDVSAQTVAQADVLGWIRQRRQSHWYANYRDLYEAIGFAAEFQQAMAQATARHDQPCRGREALREELVPDRPALSEIHPEHAEVRPGHADG